MDSQAKRYFRGTSIAVFLLSLPLFGFAASTDSSFWFFAASILIWCSLGAFCYTESFWFKPPARTKLNIYFARFFFAGSALIVLQILFVLITGRA